MEKPSIYVVCIASYNSGILHGVWIDAIQSEHKIMEQIRNMLTRSVELNAEAYAIHDYEGFGNIRIHEFEPISRIVEYALFIEEYGQLGIALLEDYSLIDAQTMLEEYYQGCYVSKIDFASQLFDECYAHQLPEQLSGYFDYEAFASDLFMSDYCSIEVGGQAHIFAC